MAECVGEVPSDLFCLFFVHDCSDLQHVSFCGRCRARVNFVKKFSRLNHRVRGILGRYLIGENQMPRGGKQPGAGRPIGSKSERTIALEEAMAEGGTQSSKRVRTADLSSCSSMRMIPHSEHWCSLWPLLSELRTRQRGDTTMSPPTI